MSRRSARERPRATPAAGKADARGAERSAAHKLPRGATPGTRRSTAPSLPPWSILTLILFGAIILHRSALRLPFFADDYLFLEQVRGRSLLAALMAPDGIGNFFRPVGRQLYFWVVGHVSGESPRAFHAVNLGLFLGILALLFAIVRRLAGNVAAAVAASFLALHYAADVPLRWVSGSQDLLAVLGALAAIALHLAGRRAFAAVALLVGLLAKEAVVFTPLIAAAADWRPGERWRVPVVRAWPLAAATALWAAVWLATQPQRHGLAASLAPEPLGTLAVLAHLVHVSVGLEWRGAFLAMGEAVLPLLPLIPIVFAVLASRREKGERRASFHVLIAGAVWAVVGAAPIIAVASIWSAYYYLFALCGVALVLGSLVGRTPRWVAVAVVVLLATSSQVGRGGKEFATGRGAWTWQSHINRLYIDRATERLARYLADLKQARPTVPPRSTFFFAGVPAFLAWQSADGPLVRWAYRDTSLRSFYQSDFSLERAGRGPVYFFAVAGDTLREEARQLSQLRGVALRVLLNERIDAARDVLVYLNEHQPPAADVHYFLAWLEWAGGDTIGAAGLLRQANLIPDRGPAPEVDRAAALLAAGNSTAAVQTLMQGVQRHALDPRLHAVLADAAVRVDPADPQARIEAFAARALASEDGMAWLRWGVFQAYDGRHSQAVRSLEHALALGIADSSRVAQVRAILVELRTMLPGGELAQEELSRPAEGSKTPQWRGPPP
jgi:hypothetical protein